MNRKSWFEVFSESYNNGIHSGTDGSETNQNWLDTHFPGNGKGEGDTPDYGQLNHPQGPPQIDDPSVYDELDGDGESNAALPYGEQGVDSDHANGMAHAATLFDLFASDVAGEGANYITNSVETAPKTNEDIVIDEQNIINNPQSYGKSMYLPAQPSSYDHLRYRPKVSTSVNPFAKSAREIKDYSTFDNPGDAPHVPISKERLPQEPEQIFDMLQPAPLGKKKLPAFSRYTEDDKDAPRANPSLYSQNSIRQKPYRDEEAREGSNVQDIMYPDEVEIKHRRSTEDFGTKDPSSDDTMANSPTKGYSGSDMDNHLFSGIDRSASLFDLFSKTASYPYGKTMKCRGAGMGNKGCSGVASGGGLFCTPCKNNPDRVKRPAEPATPQTMWVDKHTQRQIWNSDPRNKKASFIELFAEKIPCGKCHRTDYVDIRGRLCDKCAFPKKQVKADYGHVPPAVNPNSGNEDEDAQGDLIENQKVMTDGKIFPGYRENENEADIGRQQTKQRRYYNPNEVNQNYYNFSGSAGPFGKESDGVHSGIEPSN